MGDSNNPSLDADYTFSRAYFILNFVPDVLLLIEKDYHIFPWG